jgi:flavin-dependent dehydrogenase
MEYDVAIIGGGPSGSTTGALLKKYGPDVKVGIFEREIFPRDHIGESMLPPLNGILVEMGCWDKIEAADFPIKIGATYRWGKRPELWDYNFIVAEEFKSEPRPAKFAGQRMATAFQVDRSIYDRILLDHAAELGCEVHQGTKITRVLRDKRRVAGLELESGEIVTARHYVDASGNSGILRRAMDIRCDYPSTLKNIAIYDYYQNADWAVRVGVGGTRIQVLSLGYGWLWFIPLGPTRTSIGLVLPVEYFKSSGKTPEELYRKALEDEPIVAALTRSAQSEGLLQTTRDWSFLAEKQAGDNWFLVGECAGFADPILSAGVLMAHTSARQLAFTILEIDRGEMDPNWLKQEYAHRQTERIRTHIRFADYWYTANEQLKELKEFTSKLADDIGMEMTPEGAWDWIARGGFIDEELTFGTAGFELRAIQLMSDMLIGEEIASPCTQNNVFKLDFDGAKRKERAVYSDGRVASSNCYIRNGKVLPEAGPFVPVVHILRETEDLARFLEKLQEWSQKSTPDPASQRLWFDIGIQVLEALVTDGWVRCSHNPAKPLIKFKRSRRGIVWNTDMADLASASPADPS